MSEITAEELKERVALVKRFRELLLAQRERFRVYLESLDHQKAAIESGKVEDILAHVEMEEKMVSDIFSIQKVIAPLEAMYQAQNVSGASNAAPDIPHIQAALENLKNEAGEKVNRNREILEQRMHETQEELNTVRNNPYSRHQPAFGGGEQASLLDMEG